LKFYKSAVEILLLTYLLKQMISEELLNFVPACCKHYSEALRSAILMQQFCPSVCQSHSVIVPNG